MRRLAILLLFITGASFADDEVLTVAVASNFLKTAEAIGERFTNDHGTQVRFVSGSTGKLYAQIVNGAPYDVFLAADRERPRALQAARLILYHRRETYAYGQLWLFSAAREFESGSCEDALMRGEFNKLAIANPETAPYGKAAIEYLESTGLLEKYRSRIVYGESVSQAAHFVLSGNAELGIGKPTGADGGCASRLEGESVGVIRQQAVVLRRTAMPDEALKFLDFLRNPVSREIMVKDGYWDLGG